MAVPAAFTLTLAISVEPNWTVDSGVNPAPLIVTRVPPVAGPEDGLMPLTTGVYVKLELLLAADVPPDVVTVTSTVAAPGGEVAVSEVPAAFTETLVADLPPNETLESDEKPLPVTVT